MEYYLRFIWDHSLPSGYGTLSVFHGRLCCFLCICAHSFLHPISRNRTFLPYGNRATHPLLTSSLTFPPYSTEIMSPHIVSSMLLCMCIIICYYWCSWCHARSTQLVALSHQGPGCCLSSGHSTNTLRELATLGIIYICKCYSIFIIYYSHINIYIIIFTCNI